MLEKTYIEMFKVTYKVTQNSMQQPGFSLEAKAISVVIGLQVI